MKTERLVLVLAFIAGFVDTSTFVGAEGIFSAHVTGNFVVFAANLFKGSESESYLKLLTFPIFALGVMLVGSLKDKVGIKNFLFSISLTLILAGMIRFEVAPFIAVFAMGMQNAVHKVFIQGGPTSTVMTGNVTSFVLESISPAKSATYYSTLKTIISFFLGCLLGSFLAMKLGLLGLILPGILVGILGFVTEQK